jgi:hypothetical protein
VYVWWCTDFDDNSGGAAERWLERESCYQLDSQVRDE